MNKKIIVGIILMLFILPVIASGEFNSNTNSSNITAGSDQVNLPVWAVGDKWAYDCEITADEDYLTFNNLELEVISDSGSVYTTRVTSKVSGQITFMEDLIELSFENADFDGEALFEKTTLGLKSISFEITGSGSYSGIPRGFRLYTTKDLEATKGPPFYPIKFPLNLGQNYEVSHTSYTGKFTLTPPNGLLDDVFFGPAFSPFDAKCEEFVEGYSVGGRKLDCYKMTSSNGDFREIYYCEDVKNVVKLIGPDIKLTLKTVGAPNTPKKPSGPTSGSSGNSYTYKTSTTDPEGNNVYYWFDWGDGKNSGWKGPYSSGQEISVSHSWSRSGTYGIKVKAKDTNDIESDWSDSLSVSMPRSRSLLRQYFFDILNKFFDRFPMLQKLFNI